MRKKSAKEELYAAVANGLRELGHELMTLIIEQEMSLLYGDPESDEPEGLMSCSSLLGSVRVCTLDSVPDDEVRLISFNDRGEAISTVTLTGLKKEE